MSTKKLIIGTLVGGITFFLLGYVFYALLLGDFFASHMGLGARALAKGPDQMQLWPIFLGNCATALLFSYIFLKWANISDFVSGARAGFVIGLLYALGFNLVMFDTMNYMDLTGTLVDPIVNGVMAAIAGGIIGLVLGKVN